MRKIENLNYFNKIHVSSLTAFKLGLINIRSFADSKQAYLMVGERCLFSCSFCAQSSDATSSVDMLSRIIWPAFEIDKIINAFKTTLKKNPEEFKKICFQVVTVKNYFNKFLNTLKIFKKEINLPVSTSISIFSEKQADMLFDAGVKSIGFAMDVSSEKIYKKIKNREFEKDKTLLLRLGKKYPGKISIHLIAGLGETDKEFLQLTKEVLNNNILFALFAFTPIPGSRMYNYSKLPIQRYRILQFLITLMKLDKPDRIFDDLIFDNKGFVQNLKNFDKYYKKYSKYFNKGEFLITMGCPYCNRPFYNDKPSDKVLYNYSDYPDKNVVLNEINRIKSFFQTN